MRDDYKLDSQTWIFLKHVESVEENGEYVHIIMSSGRVHKVLNRKGMIEDIVMNVSEKNWSGRSGKI